MISVTCKYCSGEEKEKGAGEFCSRVCRYKFVSTQPGAKEKYRQTQIRLRLSRPKTFILYRVRQNAKIRGLECTLELKDIPDIPKLCPVLHIKIEYTVGAGKRPKPNAASLDRIDNTKGYVPGNVRIISYRANELKKDGTPEELKAIGLDATRQIKRNKAIDLTSAP
jgi:hypothetical protein